MTQHKPASEPKIPADDAVPTPAVPNGGLNDEVGDLDPDHDGQGDGRLPGRAGGGLAG
ncbi:hypothetical protein HF319_15170, partial [Xanthomonas sp. Kuri4-1]